MPDYKQQVVSQRVNEERVSSRWPFVDCVMEAVKYMTTAMGARHFIFGLSPGAVVVLFSMIGMSYNVSADKESTLIDCADAPGEAVLEIDQADIAQWAQVKCTQYGHLVVPAEGYFWTFHGGYMPIVLAAQKFGKTLQPDVVNHSMYFNRIDALQLDGDAAKDVEQRARFDSTQSLITPSAVYELTAVSVNGLTQTIYFLVSDDKTIGAMPYPEGFDRPADDALLPFIVIDIEKQKKKKEQADQSTSG